MEISGKTLLHTTAEKGDLAYFRDIIRFEENLNVKDNRMYTALHYAAQNGHGDIAECLLKHGAHVNEREFDGKTPLHVASSCGRSKCVRVLLAHGADVTAVDIEDMTALHYAAAAAAYDVIAVLLEEASTDVNAGIVEYCTPLYIAVLGSLLQSMAVLPSHQRSLLTECLHVLNNDQFNFQTFLNGFGIKLPLYKPHMDYTSCISLLLENGAETYVLAKDYDDSPLLMAVVTNNPKLIATLATFGADVNAKVCNDVTLLYIASRLGFVESVEALLLCGADINKGDYSRATPLHMAAEGGHADCIKALIKHGANVNSATRQGFTPLHVLARRAAEEDVVVPYDKNLFLSDDTDVSKLTSKTSLPTQGEYKRCVQILVQNGAKINASSLRAQTPLMHAVSTSDCPNMVSVLLDANADVNAKDVTGLTSLDLAFRNDHKASLRLLRRRGAKHGDETTQSALQLPMASLQNLMTSSAHRLPQTAVSEKSVLKHSNEKERSTSQQKL